MGWLDRSREASGVVEADAAARREERAVRFSERALARQASGTLEAAARRKAPGVLEAVAARFSTRSPASSSVSKAARKRSMLWANDNRLLQARGNSGLPGGVPGATVGEATTSPRAASPLDARPSLHGERQPFSATPPEYTRSDSALRQDAWSDRRSRFDQILNAAQTEYESREATTWWLEQEACGQDDLLRATAVEAESPAISSHSSAVLGPDRFSKHSGIERLPSQDLESQSRLFVAPPPLLPQPTLILRAKLTDDRHLSEEEDAHNQLARPGMLPGMLRRGSAVLGQRRGKAKGTSTHAAAAAPSATPGSILGPRKRRRQTTLGDALTMAAAASGANSSGSTFHQRPSPGDSFKRAPSSFEMTPPLRALQV